MNNKFINSVSEAIQNKTARRHITAELESHILDKADYYMEIGYSKEVAMKRATEEMGDADETSAPFRAMYRNKFPISQHQFVAIITVVVLYALGCLYQDNFTYVGNIIYAHFISMDFLSTAIFIAHLLLLYYSRRFKDKLIPSLTIIYLILLSEHFDTLFQPMVYALMCVVTSGISTYIESIFGYSYIVPSEGYNVLSVALCVVLIILAIFVFIGNYRQERMKDARRIFRVCKTFERVTVIFLTINILIMTTATAVAYSELDYKIAESPIYRRQMIEYVINADVSVSYAELLERMKADGYDASARINVPDSGDEIPYVYQKYNNIMKVCSDSFYEANDDLYENPTSNNYSLEFEVTAYMDSIIIENMICNESDKEVLENLLTGITLNEFLKYDVYAKACDVSHYLTSDGTEHIIMWFGFDEYIQYTVEFTDGYMTRNDLEEDAVYIKMKREDMINFILDDSRFNESTEIDDMLSELEKSEIEVSEVGIKNGITTYMCEDRSSRFLMNCDEKYNLRYYVPNITSTRSTSNKGMYFTESDFQDYYIGMSLTEFTKGTNNYRHRYACCVQSDYETVDGRNIYTVKLIYAITDEFDNISHYELEFYNGDLVKKGFNGKYGEVTDQYF